MTVMEKHSKNIEKLTVAERLEMKKLLDDSIGQGIFSGVNFDLATKSNLPEPKFSKKKPGL